MLRRTALAASLLLGSCNDNVAYPNLAISVVMPDGSNPLTGRSLTKARAYFRQDVTGLTEDWVESPITDGTFDLPIPVASFSSQIQVRIELSSASGVELVGGTPAYFPAEASVLDLMVGVPGTCGAFSVGTQPTARANAGAALMGSYLLLAGGAETSGASAKLDAIHMVSLVHYTLPDASVALGGTKLGALDRSRAIVISDGAAPFLWRLYAADANATRTPVTLHAGAQTADAVVAAPGYGVAVVGGGSDVSPSDQLSWIGAADEVVTTLTLSGAYPQRSAHYASNGLWIVSRGNGDAVLEQTGPLAASAQVRIAAIPDGTRIGGQLVMSADGTQGLIFGGVDGAAMPRTDTIALSGCPDACTASAGPTWSEARTGIVVEPSGLIVGGDGATAPVATIEQVVFDSTGPNIVPAATLTTARSAAAVVRMPTGPLLVFGGNGASGVVDSTEICFPAP